jgi:hypothetical protein
MSVAFELLLERCASISGSKGGDHALHSVRQDYGEIVYVFNRAGDGSALGLVGARAPAGNQHVEEGLGLQAETEARGVLSMHVR